MIENYEEEPLLNSEEIDLVEDLNDTKDSCIYIARGGTDECRATFILHKDSIIASSWYNYRINMIDLEQKPRLYLMHTSDLQAELLSNNIVISGEYFQWYMVPRWF